MLVLRTHVRLFRIQLVAEEHALRVAPIGELQKLVLIVIFLAVLWLTDDNNLFVGDGVIITVLAVEQGRFFALLIPIWRLIQVLLRRHWLQFSRRPV